MSGAGRRVALVGLIVAACAGVAVAARGDHRDDGGAVFRLGEHSAQTSGLVLVVLTLLAVGLMVWAWWMPGARPPAVRRRSWRDAIAPLIAGLVLAAILGSLRNDEPPRRDTTEEPATDLGGVPREAADEAPGPPPSPVGSLALAGIAVAALAGTALVIRRGGRSQPRDELQDGDNGDGVAAASPFAPASPLETAAAERDPRRAIMLTFAAAEHLLASSALGRARTQAPREWLAAARRGSRDAKAVDALGRIIVGYEIARFSDHSLTDADRLRALDALADLQAAMTTARVHAAPSS